MEGAKWNLRKCYVRLWRCDFDGRGSSPRDDDRGVSVAPPALGAADHVLEYGDVLKTTIKCESDVEVSVIAQCLDTVLERSQEDSVHDPGWLVEELGDFVMENKLNADMVKAKQELETGPTILQPQTALHPSPTQEGDFVVKMEEIDEVMVKQEPHIESTVLQPPPAPLAQAGPEPRPGTSSWGCGAPAALRTAESHTLNAFISPISQLKAQDGYCDEGAGGPSSQRALSERSDDCTGGEDTAEDKREDGQQCECHICRDTTTRNSFLIDHLRKRICEKAFKLELGQCSSYPLADLKRCSRTHTGEKPFKCEQCEYSAPYLSYLKRHLRTHTGEKPYKCKQCDYSAAYLNDLKRHMRTHTGEKLYKCGQCNYSAFQLSSLKSHMCNHTGEKPYKCEQCDYSTSHLGNLKTHMRTHTGEKPYKCEQCGHTASQLSHLKTHMHTHTVEKPYKCDQCDYTTSQSGHLKTHMHTHTGKKSYKCKQCDYSAPYLSYLKRHLLTHTGEKPYKCEQCDYSTAHLNDLKRHMSTHTGEKPHKCEQCDYSACQLSRLKRHMCTHTGEKP